MSRLQVVAMAERVLAFPGLPKAQWRSAPTAGVRAPRDPSVEGAENEPVPCWEYNGRFIRAGRHPHLKSIGNGLSIRCSTGEVFAEPCHPEALYA